MGVEDKAGNLWFMWSWRKDLHHFYAHRKNGTGTTPLPDALPQMTVHLWGKAQPRARGHLIWKGWGGHQGPQPHTSFLPTKCPPRDDKCMWFGTWASLCQQLAWFTPGSQSLLWRIDDGIRQLLWTADILQKVYLNVHYIIAHRKTCVRAKK